MSDDKSLQYVITDMNQLASLLSDLHNRNNFRVHRNASNKSIIGKYDAGTTSFSSAFQILAPGGNWKGLLEIGILKSEGVKVTCGLKTKRSVHTSLLSTAVGDGAGGFDSN